MKIYFLYLLIFLIFIFLIYTAYKAISRGMYAKMENEDSSNEDNIIKSKETNKQLNISSEIKNLKRLYEEGTLSKEEYEKAKKKVIND